MRRIFRGRWRLVSTTKAEAVAKHASGCNRPEALPHQKRLGYAVLGIVDERQRSPLAYLKTTAAITGHRGHCICCTQRQGCSVHFTHSRSDASINPDSRRRDLRALQPKHACAKRRAAQRRAELISATARASLADVVASALETDAVIDLRINRGETDARFKRVSGRVVELKNKRLLQLTYKRRGACDLQRNHAFLGDDGAEGADGDLLPPKKMVRAQSRKACFGGRRARRRDRRRHGDDLTKGSLTSASCAPAKKTASHDRAKKRAS